MTNRISTDEKLFSQSVPQSLKAPYYTHIYHHINLNIFKWLRSVIPAIRGSQIQGLPGLE